LLGLEADLPLFFEHQIDPEASRMADFPSRDESAFREHWARILADEGMIKRAIVADGVVAGYVGAYRESGRLQVGYWLCRAHWGRGLATSALSLFLEDRGAAHLGLRRCPQHRLAASPREMRLRPRADCARRGARR
jgi:RimJ/RimL family protein N-acetyltransferase